jgi:hypothetical protein
LQGNWQNKFAMEMERLGALKPIDLLRDSVTLWLISTEVWQNATAFLFGYASITCAADFTGDLTRRDKYDFLSLLQPKSGFLPEAGRGRPKLLKRLRTGRTKPGNRFQGHFQGQARQLISQAFGRASLCAAKSAAAKFTQYKNELRFAVLMA